MKAILKCKHLLFCNLVNSILEKQGIEDPLLNEMIDEMIACFDSYMQTRAELFLISQQYEAKQKKIKNRFKELKKVPFELKPVI